MKTMWLEEKVFIFSNKNKINFNDELLLVVNDKVSDINISETFFGAEKDYDNNKISGYSILEHLTPEGKLEIDNQISKQKELYDIKIINKSNSEIFGFQRIRNTWFQSDDFEVGQSEVDKILNRVVGSIQEKGGDTSEPQTPPLLFNSEEYEEDKKELLSKGFVEQVDGNFRYLIKHGEKPKVIEIKENAYDILKLTQDVNDSKKYNFTDSTGKINTIAVE